jgi:hypothetical protein
MCGQMRLADAEVTLIDTGDGLLVVLEQTAVPAMQLKNTHLFL